MLATNVVGITPGLKIFTHRQLPHQSTISNGTLSSGFVFVDIERASLKYTDGKPMKTNLAVMPPISLMGHQ